MGFSWVFSSNALQNHALTTFGYREPSCIELSSVTCLPCRLICVTGIASTSASADTSLLKANSCNTRQRVQGCMPSPVSKATSQEIPVGIFVPFNTTSSIPFESCASWSTRTAALNQAYSLLRRFLPRQVTFISVLLSFILTQFPAFRGRTVMQALGQQDANIGLSSG